MYEQCPDISRQAPTPFLHRIARPYLFESLARGYGFQEIGSPLILQGHAVSLCINIGMEFRTGIAPTRGPKAPEFVR